MSGNATRNWIAGQQVRVRGGLFAGHIGRVLGPSEAQRLPAFVEQPGYWIVISLLDEETPVSFLAEQLTDASRYD